jgi:hypothetical protein
MYSVGTALRAFAHPTFVLAPQEPAATAGKV